MLTRLRLYTVALAFLIILPDFLIAQESGFFQGKTIRIIVGTSPGGGFDVYSRTIGTAHGQVHGRNP